MSSVADCLRAAAFSPNTLTPQAGAILWSILIPETLLRAIAAYLVRCTILSLTALHIPLAALFLLTLLHPRVPTCEHFAVYDDCDATEEGETFRESREPTLHRCIFLSQQQCSRKRQCDQ